MSYYSGGEPRAIKPTASVNAFEFLGQPNAECKEAWLIAKAGINANGPLVVRLHDEDDRPVSDAAEVYSSAPARVKFTNVNISAGSVPPLIKVLAVNRSTAEQSNASVNGVLLVY